MTTYAETDSYATFGKSLNASGGLNLKGLSAANIGLVLGGFCGTAPDTTKSTAGTGAVIVQAMLKSGTSGTSVGADGNLFVIINNSATRFIFDAEGSAHADVEWTTYDKYDDLALLDTFESEMVRREFGAFMQENRAALQRAGVVNFYDDGPRAMVNFTKLSMLLVGAMRQTGKRLNQIENRLAALPAA